MEVGRKKPSIAWTRRPPIPMPRHPERNAAVVKNDGLPEQKPLAKPGSERQQKTAIRIAGISKPEFEI